jgi:2Fe-2S ferredoxin
MPRLVFIDPSGHEHVVEAGIGQSVMRAAVGAQIPGIEALCGGNCICATCHAYIDRPWYANFPPPDDTESAMIECTSEPRENSRLTCQLSVTPAHDGVVIRLPASQH